MHEPASSDDEFFDELLAAPGGPSHESLRQDLLVRTSGLLRRRHRMKRVGLAAALLCCYLAGVATHRLFTAMPAGPDRGQLAAKLSDATAPVDGHSVEITDATPGPETQALAPQLLLPAAVLERLAETAPDAEYRTMCRWAGDRYMKESGDLAAALRCYRRALDATPPEHLAISDDDNWLIASLKQARLEEFRHANNGG